MEKQNNNEALGKPCDQKMKELFDFDYFRTLFDPVRSELLIYLAVHGPRNISEISKNFPQDRSVISRHLDMMCKQGILKKRKESRYMIYEAAGWNIIDKFEETAKRIRELMTECE